MADHIPFVNSQEDCKLLKKFYSDSVVVRLSLETLEKTIDNFPLDTRLWIDPAVDGLHNWGPNVSNRYRQHIARFSGFDRIVDSTFQNNPEQQLVKNFVESVLGACVSAARKPLWISVPQLPVVSNSSRNKINRLLARSAGEWKVKRKFSGKLILPVILTHQNQVNLKTQRKGPISLAASCFNLAGAEGVWVVESTLADQDGSKPLERRFAGLIQFHQELAQLLPPEIITVAGPYWGMNLILWARGLARYPSIGLGNAYRYYIPGVSLPHGNDHVALSPLKRWVIASPQLKAWLKRTLPRVPPQDNAYDQLEVLYRYFDRILLDWRSQVAEFYKKWFDKLEAVPASGRPLALFQQLSSAYVLGKSLPELPRDEKTARRPERVAQHLMLNCL